MPNIQRILCPVDFSDGSKAALTYAAMLAARFDARVDVLHIWEPAPYDTAGDLVSAGDRGGEVRTELAARLAALMEAVGANNNDRITPIIASGYPAQSILARLQDEDYDLTVMGTAGRTGVAHLIMGSVAERVVRSAPCPVLTLRADSLHEPPPE